MNWLKVFPAFRQVLDAVSNTTVYIALMYLCFALTIVSCAYWTRKIGANGIGLFWVQPLPYVFIGFGLAAAIGYAALFTDMTNRSLAGGTGLHYLTSSVLLFAVYYCAFFPLLVGGTLGLGIKAILALVKKYNEDQ